MSKLRSRILYVILLLMLGLSVFMFLKLQKVNETLKLEKSEREKLEKAELASAYKEGDSLMFQGDYPQALQKYKRALATTHDTLKPELIRRIGFLKEFLQIIEENERLEQDTALETAKAENQEEQGSVRVREFDSISFALKKAKLKVQNLKRQIQKQTSGDYLSFQSSKGSKIYYVGEVVDGMANGKGIALLETGSRYEGEWKDNMRHGQGAFYWLDGEYYVGDYTNDKREGFGKYFWPNGEKYVGEWKQDKRNGTGKFYNKEGELITEGVWKNDELVKQFKD